MNNKLITAVCLTGSVLTSGVLFADYNAPHASKTNEPAVVGHKAFPLDVKFEVGKADLKLGAAAEADFQKAVQELKNYPNAKLEIEGYTDSTGSTLVNEKLSEERAAAIRKHFIDRYGIEPSRITTAAYAAKKPVASNESVEGRSVNRRAIARVYRLEPLKTGETGHNL